MMSRLGARRLEDLLVMADGGVRTGTRSLLLGVILLFLLTMVLWAALAEVDQVTRAQGKVVPSGRIQVLETYEGGVVRELRVREGDRVEAGQVLMVLDGGMLEGGYREIRAQYLALLVRARRLQAEAEGVEPVFTALQEQDAPEIVAAERRLYEGRAAELRSELRVLDQQLFQRRRELGEARIARDTAQRALALAERERAIVAPLVERGIEPEFSLLALDRSLAELGGQVERSDSALERLRAAVAEVEDQKTALRERFRAGALATYSETLARISEIEEGMPAREEQIARTELRAPVPGVVNRMHVTTIGGVARPGDPLVELVPRDDALRIEAHVLPSEIAFLHPGQTVKVKLTAYDFARYGGLDGELEVIGADAVEVPELEARAYPVQVRTRGELLDATGEPLEILPGMVAEVDILGRRRTVLSYLTEPVVKVRERAFRD